ncbi:ORF1 [Grizzly bear anellovirus 10]|nr:ORF1 [Grizzly bear anellovirus 10]
MAYAAGRRRRYYPRRRSYWGRHRYRRPWRKARYLRYRARRFGQRKRRSITAAKPVSVKQWNPRFRARCKIRGWTPLTYTAAQGIPLEVSNFNATHDQTALNRGGGWFRFSFGLTSLYKDNKTFRNRWSRSNAGFDMARYWGCRLTFAPTDNWDYVVVPQRDFPASFSGINDERVFCAPGMLITHPNKILVLSNKTGGARRRWPSIWVSPPSWLSNTWRSMKDLAGVSLVRLIGSFVDINNAWAKATDKVDAWWQNTNWAKDWGGGSEYVAGPFVVTELPTRVSIVMFYQFYFEWGGVTLYPQLAVDPTVASFPVVGAQDLAQGFNLAIDPRDADNFLSFPGDFSPGGTLDDGVFRSLTRPPTERARMAGFSHHAEEESSETSSDETDQEAPDQGPPRPLRSMGLQHRRRDRMVRRLRRFIRRVVEDTMYQSQTPIE